MHNINDELIFNSIVNEEESDKFEKEELRSYNPKGYEKLINLEKKSAKFYKVALIVSIILVTFMFLQIVSFEFILLVSGIIVLGVFITKVKVNKEQEVFYKVVEEEIQKQSKKEK